MQTYGGAVYWAAPFFFAMKAALQHLQTSDEKLAHAIALVGDYRPNLEQPASVFIALGRAVVFQQLSTKAANTIYGRALSAFGTGEGLSASQVAAADFDSLRAVGLSRQKIRYLQALATAEQAGDLPALADLENESDESIISSLVIYPGIGRWTVQMFLMFGLARQDVLPSEDLGIRKGFAKAFQLDDLPKPKDIEEHATRWQPYRSVASWYLWRILEV